MARSIGRHYTLHINVGVQHTVILTYATKPSVNKDGAVALIFPKSMTSTATPSTHTANVLGGAKGSERRLGRYETFSK
jgi:hypothetical protein